MANQSQTSCEASQGRGKESLDQWSRSPDQDGRHAHKVKTFEKPSPEPEVL